MLLKYKIEINNKVICKRLKNLTNQIYKLLPVRQEGGDWEKLLQSILEECAGMQRLIINKDIFFNLLIKLQGLYSLIEELDFSCYRKTIFECLNLIDELKEEFSNDGTIE